MADQKSQSPYTEVVLGWRRIKIPPTCDIGFAITYALMREKGIRHRDIMRELAGKSLGRIEKERGR